MVFINKITGIEVVAESLDKIPGNIVNRGLSHEYIRVDMVMIEYARLIEQFKKTAKRSSTIKNVSLNNTLKGIVDMERFCKRV